MQVKDSLPGIFALSVALSTTSAGAQAPDGPDNFGTQDDAILVVGFMDFDDGGQSQSSSSSALRWSTSGGELIASVNGLPNGALVTQIGYNFHDSSQGEDLTFSFCENYINVDGTLNEFARRCYIPMTTGGAAGDGALFQSPDWTIQYRRDVGNDGDLELVQYVIRATTPSGTSDTSVRAARLRWQRQVSPAPQAASFNDVPTGDSAFQFIEALVASGITVGCGGGNYCPDAPLTRRQMAVFLAKALGLHWPWDAP
jgi:S-layer family protein